MPLYAVFYANDNPLALAVREETRRPGQAWDTVPSHCAALFPVAGGASVFEYVTLGWNLRKADERDNWRVEVPLPDPEKAYTFAATAKGKYDWDGVLSWLINAHLPPGLMIADTFPAHYDCSRYLAAVCIAGGLVLPPALMNDCPSPNDLLHTLESMVTT